jgi:competence protein ComGC
MEFTHPVNTELTVNENVQLFLEAYRKANKGTEPGLDEIMSFMKQAEVAINSAGIGSIKDALKMQQAQIDSIAKDLVESRATVEDLKKEASVEKSDAKVNQTEKVEKTAEEKKPMSTTKKVVIGTAVGVAVAGGAYVGYKAMKKKDNSSSVPMLSA